MVADFYHLLLFALGIIPDSTLSLITIIHLRTSHIAALRGRVLVHARLSHRSVDLPRRFIFCRSGRVLLTLAAHHSRLIWLRRECLLLHIFRLRQQLLLALGVVKHTAPDMLEALLNLALAGQLALAQLVPGRVVVAAVRHLAPGSYLLVHYLFYYLRFKML